MQPFIFLAHLLFLALAALGIYAADHQAFAWMRGKRSVLKAHHLERSHWMVTVGLVGLVFTGLYLFWPSREYLLGQPAFLLKLMFVLALLINSFFIESLMPLAHQYRFNELSAGKKLGLLLSGAVSTTSWVGAGVAALIVFGL